MDQKINSFEADYLPAAKTKKVMVAFVLLVGLAVSLFGFQLYNLYQHTRSVSTVVAAGQPLGGLARASVAVENMPVPMSQVASMNLFGVYKEPVVPVVEEKKIVLEELPETNLQLTLKAAFTHSEKYLSSAIITSNERSATVGFGSNRYFVNDVLPGNAILHEVHKDSVVLKRGTDYETLHFPGYSRPLRPTVQPRRAPGQRKAQVKSTVEDKSVAEDSALTGDEELANHLTVRRSIKERLARLRNR